MQQVLRDAGRNSSFFIEIGGFDRHAFADTNSKRQ
jgi:hypothetical protein